MDDLQFAAIIDSLAAALARVESTVQRVRLERWDEVIHTGDGAWTRRQLLAHIAANDLRQLVRVRIGAGIPEPGDAAAHEAELDTLAWNTARVGERKGCSIDELIAEMRANRAALINLLRSLTPGQRVRAMPFRGTPAPLEAMIPTLLGHLDQHATEISGPAVPD